MPTEATFRFSTYLTLALACVALGYAQAPMLPEVAVFAALACVALGALYFVETRVALLTIPAANRLGGIVAAAFLIWAAYRIQRELNTNEFSGMGWNMLFVAMCGPLVMLLLAAKVARGEKHAGDYWTLHGAALAGVALAAAFAEEPLCFALVGLYLTAAVWSLSLFHLNRAAGHVPAVPDPKVPPPRTAAASGEPHGTKSGFRPALLWALIAGAGAVPLYLLTPRSEAPKADFGKPRVEIGYAADQMTDLNRTGPLKANTETAFEVVATLPDGTPKTDLNPDQRWRGVNGTRREYAGGEWRPLNMIDGPAAFPNLTRLAKPAPDWRAPDLGTGQFFLAYNVPAKLRAHVLADPIAWVPDQPVPIATTTDAGPRGWLPNPDGTFSRELGPRVRGQPFRYVQVYRTGPDADLGPGFHLSDVLLDDSLNALRENRVDRVKEFADNLVIELIANGKLPAEWRDPKILRDPRYRERAREEHHDLIARAFAAYLATTPTLHYTTDLKREDTKIDPVEDFLYHTKAGHCERFATALALMLRSQGIPSVLVLGFKGCEHTGDGNYLVKQEHAHAWVEALVSLPTPAAERRAGEPTRRYHWRSLDPTPGGSDATANAAWWEKANSWVGSHFQHYVVDYTPEQRRKDLAGFAHRLTRPETLLTLAVVLVLVIGVRTFTRRRAARAAEPPAPVAQTRWFGQLVALLAAHGIRPGPGDTPQEFATTAADALRARPGCAGVAGVPVAWAEAYYQDRFGGLPPARERLAELESDLNRLRLALESRG